MEQFSDIKTPNLPDIDRARDLANYSTSESDAPTPELVTLSRWERVALVVAVSLAVAAMCTGIAFWAWKLWELFAR